MKEYVRDPTAVSDTGENVSLCQIERVLDRKGGIKAISTRGVNQTLGLAAE